MILFDKVIPAGTTIEVDGEYPSGAVHAGRGYGSYWVCIQTNQVQHKKLDGLGYFDKVVQFRNHPQSDSAYAYQDSSRKDLKTEIFNGEIRLTNIHGLDRYAKPGEKPKYVSVIFHLSMRNRSLHRMARCICRIFYGDF